MKSLGEEIEALVRGVANNTPPPRVCLIESIYEDGIHADVKTDGIGLVEYRRVLGSFGLGDTGVLLFQSDNINDSIVLIPNISADVTNLLEIIRQIRMSIEVVEGLIEDEESARKSADDNLSIAISDEISARESADTTITNTLNTHTHNNLKTQTIPQNADLNSYKTNGVFKNTSNTQVRTMDNTPWGNKPANGLSFVMVVMDHAGVTQILRPYNYTNYDIWIRNFYKDEWGGWKKVYTDGNLGNASQSADGLLSSTDKKKLDGITESADAVSFTRTLTTGQKTGTININGSATDIYTADKGTTAPLMDNGTTGTVGTSDKYAREDHIHPTDTSRASADHTHSSINVQNITVLKDFNSLTTTGYYHVTFPSSVSNCPITASDTTTYSRQAIVENIIRGTAFGVQTAYFDRNDNTLEIWSRKYSSNSFGTWKKHTLG